MQIDGKGGVGFTRGTATIELRRAMPDGTRDDVHARTCRSAARSPPSVSGCSNRSAKMMTRQALDALNRSCRRGLAWPGAAHEAGAVRVFPAGDRSTKALALLAEHGGRRQAARRRAEPHSGDELPPGHAGGARRSERASRELSHIIKDAADGLRIGGMTRHAHGRAQRRSSRARRRSWPQTMPFIAHAGDPDARHHRRQPGARGSGGGTAGRDAGARRAISVAQNREGSRDSRGDRFFHRPLLHRARAGRAADGDRDSDADARARGSAFRRSSRGATATSRWPVSPRRSPSMHKGTCAAARVALFSVGDRPVLAQQGARLARRPDADRETRFAPPPTAAAAMTSIRSSDIHASSRYRRQLAAVLTRRVLERAFDRVH